MRIMVIDVAAISGGAVTVLNQFIQEFKNDSHNSYDIIISSLDYMDSSNVIFHKIPWVKKSYLHRLYFDNVYIKKLIREYKPDLVFSLQNKTVSAGNIPQDVFYHNALPIAEIRYRFNESKTAWMYQNIIGEIYRRSLKKAKRIYVQAGWIRQELIKKWSIEPDSIIVKKPNYDTYFETLSIERIKNPRYLFYPANGAIYKNHITLIKAFYKACKQKLGFSNYTLVLTGCKNDLSYDCVSFINEKEVPIWFIGRLTKEQMREWYRKSLVVFPSVIETIGLPLAEAKSSGCYILAADCQYAHETIGEYENAGYFSPFDEDELSEKIIRTLNMLQEQNYE